MVRNPFILASDGDASVLPLIRENPSIASSQDEHGYSLLHATASYNHLKLLDDIVTEFKVDINLRDEDGETALFVVETLEAAQALVEKYGIDITIRNVEGQTAQEKIAEEGDFVEVAVYLKKVELERLVEGSSSTTNGTSISTVSSDVHAPPPMPEGVKVNLGTMSQEEVGEVADPDFKRRIDELAARPDFQDEAGQAALKDLITQFLNGDVGEQRDVRQRTD